MAVLCEKPLASDLAQGERIASGAARAGLPVWVGCCLRFDPGLIRVRQLLPALGPLHAVRIEAGSYLPEWRAERDWRASYAAKPRGGGVILDLVHEIDYALWLFGPPLSIVGRAENLGRLGIESEEIAESIWSYAGGPSLSIALDYLSRPPRRRLRASGAEGELIYDLFARTLTHSPATGPASVETFGPLAAVHAAQAEAFSAAVTTGDGGALPPLASGLAALAVCDAWKDSARRGVAVDLRGDARGPGDA
jgi:predicted dehydrogenase